MIFNDIIMFIIRSNFTHIITRVLKFNYWKSLLILSEFFVWKSAFSHNTSRIFVIHRKPPQAYFLQTVIHVRLFQIILVFNHRMVCWFLYHDYFNLCVWFLILFLGSGEASIKKWKNAPCLVVLLHSHADEFHPSMPEVHWKCVIWPANFINTKPGDQHNHHYVI